MIRIRNAEERGHFDHGWLDTYHTFSFGDYRDPAHVHFRALRVINEDRVQPGRGFDTHGHRDMEIVTYVLEGALQHADSLGNGSVLRPGELQRMSAGTGVLHSEFNPSPAEAVHLYQVWILPGSKGIEPSYEQRSFPDDERRGRLRLVVSPDGRDGSLTIHQDATIYLASLDARESVAHELAPGRHGWLQVLRGRVNVAGHNLRAGDAAAVSDESRLTIVAEEPAEVMRFDLA